MGYMKIFIPTLKYMPANDSTSDKDENKIIIPYKRKTKM